MPLCFRALTTTLVLLATFAMDLRGRQLLELNGVELRGNAQLVLSGGGTCNVFESDTSYEERKENHGAPMDIWRLDLSVHNGSGRWLDHLIARFQIASTWPECTNWDVPQARRFAQPIEWTGSNGHIQKSGRNVVEPGQIVTHTKFFIVLRGDPEPRFSNWSMDFDFATAPPPPGLGSASAQQQTLPVANPEQENMFWQSIVDSTNPAMFEAYLAQFPNGVFRALAEVRLAELRAPGSDSPQEDRFPAEADSGSDHVEMPQPICEDAGTWDDPPCWLELTSHLDCYVWGHPMIRPPKTWTGGCSGRLAEGSGLLAWVLAKGETYRGEGVLRNGKRHGRWVERTVVGHRLYIDEGPYVDGKRHGRWVERITPDGTVSEGPYVDGLMHGPWIVRRGWKGKPSTWHYVKGKPQ